MTLAKGKCVDTFSPCDKIPCPKQLIKEEFSLVFGPRGRI